MRFLASWLERLGRRIAAAPRAVLVALAALTAAASPGVIRSDLAAAPALASGVVVAEPRSESLAPPEALLVELSCDAGLWSRECLERVDALSRALSERADLVAGVDSLSARPRVVLQEDGRLGLRALAAELPADPVALRRMRARASADRAFLRGVASANERAALLQVSLSPRAAARDVHGFVESLRAQFQRPPALTFAVASRAQRAHELEAAARHDLSLATPVALLGLMLLGALAAGSLRIGAALAALAAAALVWCAAALALARISLGPAAAVLPCLVCASAAATGLALLHRISSEQRGGRALGSAIERALAGAGAPLVAAALAGAAAFAALGFAARPVTRPLALASACGVVAALALVGAGLPAFLLALRGSDSRRGESLASAPLGAFADAALARLDGMLRAPRGVTVRRIFVSAALAALALFGVGQLRGDAGSERFFAADSATSESLETLARDFGGTALVRVVVDSGAPGGAAEPLFLERVQSLERSAADLPGVGSVRSLVDAALLPAMRALHDDDPGFAVVPPTREQVESVYRLFAGEAPEQVRAGLDTDRRRLAIDVLVDARDSRQLAAFRRELEARAAQLFGRADALELHGEALSLARESERITAAAPLAALVAVAASFAIAALAFESALAGALAALPAAPALLLLFGAMGPLGVPLDFASAALAAFVAAAAAGPGLLYLARVRELGASGAELHVAVSVALRDVGRPIAQGALASLSFLSLLGSTLPPLRSFGLLACVGAFAAVGAALVALPSFARALHPDFLLARFAPKPEATLSRVRGAGRASEE